jgi:hypothetical protein
VLFRSCAAYAPSRSATRDATPHEHRPVNRARPLIQPSRNLTFKLIRGDQPQQRPDQDLGHHRQKLHIVITDERSDAFQDHHANTPR